MWAETALHTPPVGGKQIPEIEPSEKTKWGMNKWGMETTRKDTKWGMNKMGDEKTQ